MESEMDLVELVLKIELIVLTSSVSNVNAKYFG